MTSTTTDTRPAVRPVNSWQRWAPVVYYGGLGLLLAVIVAKGMADIVPGGLGKHIAQDSEGYLLALTLPAWIEFVRPRLAGRRDEWVVTFGVAVLLLVVSLWFYNSRNVIGSVKTLNETTFALVVLIPYVQLMRRPSRLGAAVCALGVVVLTVALDDTSMIRFTTPLAEGVIMLILAPIIFDITDRGILRPRQPSAFALRVSGWVLLLALPLLAIAVKHGHPTGAFGDTVRYVTRAQEAFVGMLLVSLYFAVRRSPRLNRPA